MSQGTQVFSRKQIAMAGLPDYVREAEGLVEKATSEKDRGTRNGLFEKALAIVQGGVGTNKRGLHDCLLMAECCWELVRPQESIEYLKEAIQLAPKDARPYALLGRYLVYKGLRDQALNFLDRAIQLDPDDQATRKLRERAALQKKKQYTVVVNAADVAALAPQKKENQQLQRKAEATRLLDLGQIKEAQAELQKAEHGANNALDAALSSLLGGSLTQADISILLPEAPPSRAGGIVRAIIGFTFVLTLALVLGVAAKHLAPKSSGSPSEQLTALLLSDRTSSLIEAATKADETPDDRTLVAKGALAHALLYVEHTKEVSHREAAIGLLADDDATVKRAPAAVFARALLAAHGDEDPTLDDDIAASPREGAESTFVFLAEAERARQRGDDDVALGALRRAAFAEAPSMRALHLLAQRELARGHVDAGIALLERLWKSTPLHGPSIATGAIVAGMGELVLPRGSASDGDDGAAKSADDKKADDKKADDKKADDKKADDKKADDKKADDKKADDDATDGAATSTPGARPELLARLKAHVESTDTPPLDAAPGAVVLALLGLARGDAAERDRMLQVAIGSSSSGPVTTNPLLLDGVTTVRILDFDAKGASTLLDKNSGLVDTSVMLQRNVTRAAVLAGLAGELRAVKQSAPKPALVQGALVLPAGRVVPDFARALLPISTELDTRFFPETAIESVLETKDMSPTVAKRTLTAVANIKLAQLALARDDTAGALDALLRSESVAGNNPDFQLMSAIVYAADRNKSAARDAIEEALDLAPDEPKVLVAAARIQLASGDVVAASKALKRMKDDGYTSPSALALAARVAAKKGDLEGARAALIEANAITDEDIDVAIAEIHVEDGVGEAERAVAAAMRATERAPTRARTLVASDPVAAPYLLYALARTEDGGDAERRLKEMSEKKRFGVAPTYALGLLLVDVEATKAEGLDLLKRAASSTGGAALAAQRKIDALEGKTPPVEEQPAPEPAPKKKKGRRGR